MAKLIFFLTFSFTANCFAQDKFLITELVSNDTFALLSKMAKANQDNIFEDSNYIVSRTCSGEWGGTIKFKHKKSGIEYSSASTCPVLVNKLNGKYYITNSLAHGNGFSEVLEISNPDSMTVLVPPKPRGKVGKRDFLYVGDDESKSIKGTKQLVFSRGVLTLCSFVYNNQLYHIVTDYEKTLLAKIEHNNFVIIDTVSNKRIRSYNPEFLVTEDKHLIILFENNKERGHLDIFENQIKVIIYK